ncbi:MAG TPA: caspase family protein, partial [Kofleriaceae bacterium]
MPRHALVIGSQIEGRTGAEHDAGRMRALLVELGFEVELRVGGDATRAGILDGYDALIARVTGDAAAAIYYSGHGLYSIDSAGALGPVQSIAPIDLRAGSDEDFRGITAWELAIKLAQLTAVTRNVTVMLDCCHATQMTRGMPGDPVARALPHPVRMGFATHLRALEQRYGHVPVDPIGNPFAVRVVACGQHEPAFEHTNAAGLRVGMFSEALLDVLR